MNSVPFGFLVWFFSPFDSLVSTASSFCTNQDCWYSFKRRSKKCTWYTRTKKVIYNVPQEGFDIYIKTLLQATKA